MWGRGLKRISDTRTRIRIVSPHTGRGLKHLIVGLRDDSEVAPIRYILRVPWNLQH